MTIPIGEDKSVPSASANVLCDYELERQQRIAANRKKMEELGLKACADRLCVLKPERKARQSRGVKAEVKETDIRRSAREKASVSYKEDDYYQRLLPQPVRPSRTLRVLDEDEIEALRERLHGGQSFGDGYYDSGFAPQRKSRGPVDSGKGVRIQGGKVYDSRLGVTCHWCRQKTLEDHVTCSNAGCGNGRRLPTSFCKNCLKNRHGEDCDQAYNSGKWICPLCRGSCGKGCVGCCNCGPCRKKAGLEPTHQLARNAKCAGFSNVHDYLVHLVTGESQEQIAARKHTHAWGSWLKCEPSASSEHTVSEEAGDEQHGAADHMEMDGEVISAAPLVPSHATPVQVADPAHQPPTSSGSRRAKRARMDKAEAVEQLPAAAKAPATAASTTAAAAAAASVSRDTVMADSAAASAAAAAAATAPENSLAVAQPSLMSFFPTAKALPQVKGTKKGIPAQGVLAEPRLTRRQRATMTTGLAPSTGSAIPCC